MNNILFILSCAFSAICILHPHTCNAKETDIPQRGALIAPDVYATGYYCIYNSEMNGFQAVTLTISGYTYNLKASFLYGGYGIAMQGTGRTGSDGDYIKYNGGGGCFVRIAGSGAGQNMNGKYVESPQTIRKRYAKIGITDFTGFGNLALAHPENTIFSSSSQICGSTGCVLEPWCSIAADPAFMSPGRSFTILFKDGSSTPSGQTLADFTAADIGGAIKGRHIDIYLGEGKAAWSLWLLTGGNRYVDIYRTLQN